MVVAEYRMAVLCGGAEDLRVVEASGAGVIGSVRYIFVSHIRTILLAVPFRSSVGTAFFHSEA